MPGGTMPGGHYARRGGTMPGGGTMYRRDYARVALCTGGTMHGSLRYADYFFVHP